MKLFKVQFVSPVRIGDKVSSYFVSEGGIEIAVEGPFVVLTKGAAKVITPVFNVAYATPAEEAKKSGPNKST